MKRPTNVTRSLILCFGLLLANCTFAATFVVNIAADDADAHDINPGNGICEDSLGSCTLRAAIEEANALATLDVISFANGFNNVVLLLAASEGPLPPITQKVFILGATIDLYNSSATLLRDAPPHFTIDGSQLSSGSGLVFQGPGSQGSIVSALSIVNFPKNGIIAQDGADDLLIERCYIGVKPDFSNAGNAENGIMILSSESAYIGKKTTAEDFSGLGNVISRNGHSGIFLSDSRYSEILANLIGVSPSGTGDRGNGRYGILVEGNANRIGDTNGGATAGNFIAANDFGGIKITGLNNHVYANQLGKGPTGGFIHSEGHGIEVFGNVNHFGELNGKGNKIYEHDGAAIKLGTYTDTPELYTANSNTIIGNQIGSAGSGFPLLLSGNGKGIDIDNGHGNDVEDNVVINSTEDGIHVQGDNNSLLRNKVGFVNNLFGSDSEPNGSGLRLHGYGNTIGTEDNGNYFAGNSQQGVSISGSNSFQYNFIGMSDKSELLGNGGYGLFAQVSSSTSIAYNVIGGSQLAGLSITQGQDIVVLGNYIGIAPDGNNIANGQHGITIAGSDDIPTERVLIRKNSIANNNGDAIRIGDDYVFQAEWTDNIMHSNSGLGADIGFDGITANDSNDPDEGSNRHQNYPRLQLVSFTPGDGGPLLRFSYFVSTTESNASYPLKIDLYWTHVNEVSQGRKFIRTDTYPSPDGSSIFGHIFPQGTQYGWLTAVVRDADGNSSEFAPGLMFGEVSDILFTDSFESTN